ERLGTLWRTAVSGLELRTLWWRDGDAMTQTSGERWTIDRDVATWFVHNSDALAVTDLATMKVGPVRARLEELAARSKQADGPDAGVVVPLVDRDELVGIVEAHYG